MQIATWNINGIKARMETLLAWLKEAGPDVACLQEIKSVDEQFPALEIEAAGYHVATHGQKGFNGVAILSKQRPDEVIRGFADDSPEEQSRYIEAVFSRPSGVVRVASIYLPNGNPLGTEKFTYKLAWMKRLEARARTLLDFEEPLALLGDYNVIPEPRDARYPEQWTGDALYQPQSRDAFAGLVNLGFTDALRATSDDPAYTFWDYQAGSWQKNNGIRIDHALLSPEAARRLGAVRVDRHVRAWEKPSDHVPVVVTLDL